MGQLPSWSIGVTTFKRNFLTSNSQQDEIANSFVTLQGSPPSIGITRKETKLEKPKAVTGVTLGFQSLKLLYPPPRLEEPYPLYDWDEYVDEGYDELPNWEYDLRPGSTFPQLLVTGSL